ncbi:hypothetical protein TIFTF001_039667 [Ficus carica]|uniref:Uncharacterized protein n=1 Tax=Ficus carica TaxID=3494 RepID=A0AA88JEA8_FICCA|nr:hypothetical protein TIFTF001_039667 [Ficus carica]
MSSFPHDQSRPVPPEEEVVTIVALMPNPAVHYCARIVVTVDGACSIFGRSEVPWGVPTASASGLQDNRDPSTQTTNRGLLGCSENLERGTTVARPNQGVVSLAFSGNATAQSHFNRMDDKVTELVTEVKRWQDAKKVVVRKAKKAEEQALKAEEARKKAESELVSARSEHSCYLQKVLLVTFDQARQQAGPTTRTPRRLKPVSSSNTRRG